MRRLLFFLVRLYPRSWRTRYGDELEALLEEIEPHSRDLWNIAVNGLWQRSTSMKTWQWILAGALVGSVTHAALVFAHGTGRYESTGVLAAPGAGMNVRISAVSPTGWGEEHLRAILRRNGATEGDLNPMERGEGYPIGVWAGAMLDTDGTMNIYAVARRPEQAQAMVRDVMNLVGSKAEPYWKLKLMAAPTLPVTAAPWNLGYAYAARWRLGRLIGLGTAAGAACALLLVLTGKGWARLRNRT